MREIWEMIKRLLPCFSGKEVRAMKIGEHEWQLEAQNLREANKENMNARHNLAVARSREAEAAEEVAETVHKVLSIVEGRGRKREENFR